MGWNVCNYNIKLDMPFSVGLQHLYHSDLAIAGDLDYEFILREDDF
jgi:hypothetical protein